MIHIFSSLYDVITFLNLWEIVKMTYNLERRDKYHKDKLFTENVVLQFLMH